MRAPTVVVLVLLAGCGGLVADSEPGPDQETVTPAPVPTDSGLPPGVDPSGVTGPATLSLAHGDTLAGTSYTLVTNRTVRRPNGSLRSSLSVDLRLSATRDYRAAVAARGPDGPVIIGEPPTEAEYWADDDLYLRRQQIDNRTVYSRYNASEEYVGTWRFWLGTVALNIDPETDLRRTVASFDTRVADRRTVAGREGVHLVGTSLAAEAFVDDQSDVSGVRNATLRAFAAESGFVRSYSVVYEADLPDGTAVRVRRSVRYRQVGNTTVGRPPWYEDAVAQG